MVSHCCPECASSVSSPNELLMWWQSSHPLTWFSGNIPNGVKTVLSLSYVAITWVFHISPKQRKNKSSLFIKVCVCAECLRCINHYVTRHNHVFISWKKERNLWWPAKCPLRTSRKCQQFHIRQKGQREGKIWKSDVLSNNFWILAFKMCLYS